MKTLSIVIVAMLTASCCAQDPLGRIANSLEEANRQSTFSSIERGRQASAAEEAAYMQRMTAMSQVQMQQEIIRLRSTVLHYEAERKEIAQAIAAADTARLTDWLNDIARQMRKKVEFTLTARKKP